MKKIFLIVFLLPLFYHALPDTSKIPQKWKKESVIILDYKYEYTVRDGSGSYDTYGMYQAPKHEERLYITYYIRDKWAVNELSRIVLNDLNSSDLRDDIGEIHKKNGKSIRLTKENLIENKTSANFYSKGRSRNFAFDINKKTYKLAVPNLEVGDFLELTIIANSTIVPQFLVLQNKYPMVHASYRVHCSSSNFKIQGKFLNCPLQISNANEDFTVELDTVEKIKSEILIDDEKQLPYALLNYKYVGPFAVTTPSYRTTDFNTTAPEQLQDLQLNLVRRIYESNGKEDKPLASKIMLALKKKHPKITDTLAYVKDAFYTYRELFLYSTLESFSSNFSNHNLFVATFSRILHDSKIPFKAFITQPDYFGDFNDYNGTLAPVTGIYVQGIYLFHPAFVMEPGSIPPFFENQKVYQFSINKHFKKYRYFWAFWIFPPAGLATLPLTLPPFIITANKAKKNRIYDWKQARLINEPSTSNRTEVVSNVNLSTFAGEELEVNRSYKLWGKMKNGKIRTLNNINFFYFEEENPYKKLLYPMSAAASKQSPPEDAEEKAKEEKRMKRYMKGELQDDDFNVKEVRSYKIDESNLFDKSKPFVYSHTFTAADLAWNHGNYIVMDLGKLIGEQLNVPDDGVKRNSDFYIPYQRSIGNKINITLPEGYVVENLKDFNLSSSTAAGEFTSSATLEGNTLVITTSKAYKFQFYDREDADDVYNFLREAEKFCSRKLILRKK